MSAEGRAAGAGLYVMTLVLSFKGPRRAQPAATAPGGRTLAAALRAALAAFVVGSFFAGLACRFCPALMFGYVVALQRAAARPAGKPLPHGEWELVCAA
ncbi:MAG TPA: hypothetical protein VNF74_11970 [Terriglobales bacterium]|nr:hypothetical protein [Terriglobales bacterium]